MRSPLDGIPWGTTTALARQGRPEGAVVGFTSTTADNAALNVITIDNGGAGIGVHECGLALYFLK